MKLLEELKNQPLFKWVRPKARLIPSFLTPNLVVIYDENKMAINNYLFMLVEGLVKRIIITVS